MKKYGPIKIELGQCLLKPINNMLLKIEYIGVLMEKIVFRH